MPDVTISQLPYGSPAGSDQLIYSNGSSTFKTTLSNLTASNQFIKAWVRFDGSGGLAIGGSYNISSGSRGSNSTYTFFFRNPVLGGYGMATSVRNDGGTYGCYESGEPSSTSFTVGGGRPGGSYNDITRGYVIIFG